MEGSRGCVAASLQLQQQSNPLWLAEYRTAERHAELAVAHLHSARIAALQRRMQPAKTWVSCSSDCKCLKLGQRMHMLTTEVYGTGRGSDRNTLDVVMHRSRSALQALQCACASLTSSMSRTAWDAVEGLQSVLCAKANDDKVLCRCNSCASAAPAQHKSLWQRTTSLSKNKCQTHMIRQGTTRRRGRPRNTPAGLQPANASERLEGPSFYIRSTLLPTDGCLLQSCFDSNCHTGMTRYAAFQTACTACTMS